MQGLPTEARCRCRKLGEIPRPAGEGAGLPGRPLFRYYRGKPALRSFRVGGWMLLTNADLSSHTIDQLLGIVADPGLKHRLDVLDFVNSF
jgi:hypothetical protein